jgi:hypothetical protein
MGEFYRMTRKRLRRQVVEFVDVRGFDDPQSNDSECFAVTSVTALFLTGQENWGRRPLWAVPH